jgi:fatty-acyl-CoA synthase
MSQTDIAAACRNTIGDALRRSVRRNPEREALLYEERRWTYRALDAAANRIARHLLTLGLQRGDRVAAYGRNSDAYVLLWLGCVRAGLIHVPINYALTEGELRYIIDQSGARALFHDLSTAAHIAQLGPQQTCEWSGTLHGGAGLDILAIAQGSSNEAGNDGALDVNVDAEDIAQLLYTSGTTAAPKGAMMTHRALMSEYISTLLATEISGSDRSLASLPLYHSAQMHVFVMPQLLVGATTILIDAPLPELCFKLIASERITSFFAPPTVWISLLRHADFDRHDLSTLARGYYGASIMPVPVLAEMSRRLPQTRLFNCYGQSEIAPLATVLSPEDHAERPASAGKPIFNVETRIVDEEMNDCAPGVMGEIVHRSPQLMSGYWNLPEATLEAFAGGWFHSGDVGYFDEAGYLYIADRIKDIINTGGVVVSSREVEECLYTHPAVSEVAVIGLPDEKWIEAIVAVVTLKVGQQVDAATLIAHAKQHIASFKTPKQVFFVDAMPRTASGKLLKRTLRKQYANVN